MTRKSCLVVFTTSPLSLNNLTWCGHRLTDKFDPQPISRKFAVGQAALHLPDSHLTGKPIKLQTKSGCKKFHIGKLCHDRLDRHFRAGPNVNLKGIHHDLSYLARMDDQAERICL